MDPRPKITAEHLIKYMVGRIDLVDARLEAQSKRMEEIHIAAQNVGHEVRQSSMRRDVLGVVGSFLRWSGIVSSQVSTIFIASYVAFEHSWYVAKIVGWLTRMLAWHPWG
jgi:hypothetical protein